METAAAKRNACCFTHCASDCTQGQCQEGHHGFFRDAGDRCDKRSSNLGPAAVWALQQSGRSPVLMHGFPLPSSRAPCALTHASHGVPLPLPARASERDPDYVSTMLSKVKKNQKIILMCAIGGTLTTGVNLRPDKYPNGIEDPDRSFGRESRCLKAAYELMSKVGATGLGGQAWWPELRDCWHRKLGGWSAVLAQPVGSCAGAAQSSPEWVKGMHLGGKCTCIISA